MRIKLFFNNYPITKNNLPDWNNTTFSLITVLQLFMYISGIVLFL